MMPLIFISDNREKIEGYFKKNFKKEYIIFEVTPKNKIFSINDIRDIIKETSFYNNKLRIYLFYNFHLSSLEAQNAFLKTLEEPPKNVLFVLTVDNQYNLLPTILSRSKIINLSEKNFYLSDEKKELIVNFLKNKNLDLTISEKISLSDLILFLKNKIYDKKENYFILKEILNIKNLIEKNNLKEQLAIEHILIMMKKYLK